MIPNNLWSVVKIYPSGFREKIVVSLECGFCYVAMELEKAEKLAAETPRSPGEIVEILPADGSTHTEP